MILSSYLLQKQINKKKKKKKHKKPGIFFRKQNAGQCIHTKRCPLEAH